MHMETQLKIIGDERALAEERISKSAGCIAKALNLLEAATEDIRFACDSQGWNDEVYYQVEDAAKSLGFALATLHRWNDEARES